MATLRFVIIGMCMMCLLAAGCAFGQSATDSLKVSTVKASDGAIPTEKVEGLWGVLSYVGGKFSRELGNRMNIDSGKSEERQAVRTQLKLGPFRVERMDYR